MICLLYFFGIALSNNSTAFKYSTWDHYFTGNFLSHFIAFKLAWYFLKCFDYSFLCGLSQWVKQGWESIAVLNSSKLWWNMQKKTTMETQLGNIQSVRLLFEGSFYLLFLHPNFHFYLRGDSVWENLVS